MSTSAPFPQQGWLAPEQGWWSWLKAKARPVFIRNKPAPKPDAEVPF